MSVYELGEPRLSISLFISPFMTLGVRASLATKERDSERNLSRDAVAEVAGDELGVSGEDAEGESRRKEKRLLGELGADDCAEMDCLDDLTGWKVEDRRIDSGRAGAELVMRESMERRSDGRRARDDASGVAGEVERESEGGGVCFDRCRDPMSTTLGGPDEMMETTTAMQQDSLDSRDSSMSKSSLLLYTLESSSVPCSCSRDDRSSSDDIYLSEKDMSRPSELRESSLGVDGIVMSLYSQMATRLLKPSFRRGRKKSTFEAHPRMCTGRVTSTAAMFRVLQATPVIGEVPMVTARRGAVLTWSTGEQGETIKSRRRGTLRREMRPTVEESGPTIRRE